MKFIKLIPIAVVTLGLSLGYSIATAQDQAITGVTENTIKIGIPGPFTGNASSYSKAQIGLDAYYRHINETGGVHGRMINVIKADTACNEARGIAVAKKLIHQDKVFLINGNSCSGVALAMKPTIIEAGIPWVVGHAVNYKISSPVEYNIFHVVPTSQDAGRFMAKYAMSRPETKKIAIIAHSNEWGKGYRDPAVETLKSEHKVEPILDLTMERGSTNATAQVLKIKQSGADFVIAILYEAETAIFLREAKKYDLNVPILGGYGTDLKSTLKRVGNKSVVENYQVLHMFQNTLGSGSMKEWGDIIRKYYPDEDLTAFSFASIGSGMVVVNALKAVGRDLTREKFVTEMESIRNYNTGVLASNVSFSTGDHAGVKDSGVAAFVNDKVTVFRSWGHKF